MRKNIESIRLKKVTCTGNESSLLPLEMNQLVLVRSIQRKLYKTLNNTSTSYR